MGMNALITSLPTDHYNLEELPDDALLAGTRRLAATANHTLAALLAHLAEVEARGIHRTRACSSPYTYCIYELRLSEDAAFRCAKAARLCRKFPALYDAVARGELHLTGLLLLGAHLTDENLADVLACAKHRAKRELQKLMRELDPLPDVPARVEPLGPELTLPRNPTWSEFVASFNPVRELPHGERPADWSSEDGGGAEEADATEDGAGAQDGARAESDWTAARPAPARPQRFRVQFTATQEYVDLLERARDLLSHARLDRSIEEVHLRALRELVKKLEKKKYAAADNPRQRGSQRAAEHPRQRVAASPNTRTAPRQRDAIPASVRRAVRERDGARCSYVDARGQRCRETALLELHHEVPFARGGPATAENLRLRCRAHNALAAAQDFGREIMQQP
jgi:5-methylcytosine-specific restriction endonuclease McrA